MWKSMSVDNFQACDIEAILEDICKCLDTKQQRNKQAQQSMNSVNDSWNVI